MSVFKSISIGVITLSLLLPGCSKKGEAPDQILAKINNYELTLKEFERELSSEMEMNIDFKLNKKTKSYFLAQLIEKELLILEAKRLRLDQKDHFIRTIERYWEATLIRNLMESKGKEFANPTSVSDEEIQGRYEKRRKKGSKAPLTKEMKELLAREIGTEKQRKRLSEWINELKKKTKIEVNKELLDTL